MPFPKTIQVQPTAETRPVKNANPAGNIIADNPVVASFCGRDVRCNEASAVFIPAIGCFAVGNSIFGLGVAIGSQYLLGLSTTCVSVPPVVCGALCYGTVENAYRINSSNKVTPSSLLTDKLN